jgi:threonyl-tRNA synthetase
VADPVVVPARTTTCADAVAAAGLPTTGPKAVVVVRDLDRLTHLDLMAEATDRA